MDWLADNWYWVVGAFFVYLVLRRMGGSSQPAASSGGLTQAQRTMLLKLTDALENVVDEIAGQYYTRNDRQKIALGMIAIMATDNIPLDRLVNNSTLFAEVMLKSIATLTANGQISTR